jgi:hypothetical protein
MSKQRRDTGNGPARLALGGWGVGEMVKCGECKYFARDGKCAFLASPEGKAPDRPFAHAPFWVWSDCYSDKEQVFAGKETRCPTFEIKP